MTRLERLLDEFPASWASGILGLVSRICWISRPNFPRKDGKKHIIYLSFYNGSGIKARRGEYPGSLDLEKPPDFFLVVMRQVDD